MEIYGTLIARAHDGLDEQLVEALEEDFDLEQVDYLANDMVQIQIIGDDSLMEELPHALEDFTALIAAPVLCIVWGGDDPFYKLCQQSGEDYLEWDVEDPAFDWLTENPKALKARPKVEQAAIAQGIEAWADYCFDTWLAPYKDSIDEARLRDEVFSGGF
ncbi:hypothetical protein L2750_17905 [Shewanella submarina]|uniref:Uncharacterized protein n=1 Tax=Shewanella submarina TaxID=2016376 RepID=A0ABV7GEW4_9GAMM|nr:hypothetical protein [Shewanella submarina]MCL1039008.1 hypothetical protein [Shewanella submarina]